MGGPRDIEADIKFNDKSADGLRSAENNLIKSNNRIKKESDKLSNGIGKSLVDGIAKVSPNLASSITGALTKVGPHGTAILAGIGLAAAPFISATLSAAIIGGVGLGGVIGGVALVAKDPRVAKAGKDLGQKLLGSLQKDAGPFINPVLESIDKIGARFDKLRPKFQNIFASASKFVAPLTDGLLNGIEGITNGIAVLMSRAGPVMDSLGRGFAIVGESVGQAMFTISGGSEDAAAALDLLFRGIGDVVEKSALLIRAFTEVFGVMHNFGDAINSTVRGWFGLTDATEEAKTATTTATPVVSALASNMTKLQMSTQGASGPIVTLKDQINDMAQSSRNAFSATTDLGAALDAASKAAKANGKTLDENTEKGRANRSALSSLAQTMIAKYNAEVMLNGEGAKTNAVANSNRESFIRVARSMGQSKEAAAQLANQLGLLPAKKDIRIDTNSEAAKRSVQQLQNAINSMKGRTVYVRVIQQKTGEITYGAGGGRQAPQMSAAEFAVGSYSGERNAGGPKDIKSAGQPLNFTLVVDGIAREFRDIAADEVGKYAFGVQYGRS